MERGPRRGPEYVHTTTIQGADAAVTWTPLAIGPSDETSDHEADHVVASDAQIYSATRIRSGNALGSTRPKRLTLAGAGASGDHDGTSGDEAIVRYYFRSTWARAKAAGRAKLAGKRFERMAVAASLHRNGTIFQSHVDEAYKLAEKVRKGVANVVVFFRDRKGNKLELSEETTKSAHEVLSNVIAQEEKREGAETGLETNKEHEVFSAADHDQAYYDAEFAKIHESSLKEEELVGI